MKILLTGSFCSGKTTLLNHLHLLSPDAYLIREVAGPILAQNPQLQQSKEFQLMVLEQQLLSERETEESGNPLIICDRGTLDIICFSKYYDHPIPFDALLKNHIPYDFVFLCSPEGIDTQGRYNSDKETMRIRLHDIFQEVMRERGIGYVLLSGNPEVRLQTLREICSFSRSKEGFLPGSYKGKECVLNG